MRYVLRYDALDQLLELIRRRTSRTPERTGCGGGPTTRSSATTSARNRWKKYLFPPSERLSASATEPTEKLVFIGVRACELRAIAIQDRVFLGGRHPDPQYAARWNGVFIVAVNRGQAGRTCFCVSMAAGPAPPRASISR